MKLRYTERAIADLEEIQSYIAQDNASAALAVGSRLKSAIDLLAHYPRLGRPSRIRGARVLLAAATPYAVYYSVSARDGEITILHIRHGRRRPPKRRDL
jgi:plasmid stabilization system protein ParE